MTYADGTTRAMRVLQYILVLDGRQYMLTLSAGPKLYAAAHPRFMAMLRSFKIR